MTVGVNARNSGVWVGEGVKVGVLLGTDVTAVLLGVGVSVTGTGLNVAETAVGSKGRVDASSVPGRSGQNWMTMITMLTTPNKKMTPPISHPRRRFGSTSGVTAAKEMPQLPQNRAAGAFG